MSDEIINESITDSIRRASLALGRDIEISLIEQLLALVNNGVIEVSYLIPRHTFDLERTKVDLSSAIGVKFKGKELIVSLESKLKLQEEIIGVLEEALKEIDRFVGHFNTYEASTAREALAKAKAMREGK
jgi:hypothetical protein